MNVTRQLYKLQETDQELASKEKACADVTAQLGESSEVIQVRNELDARKHELDETSHSQHNLEWEIEDISARLAKFEEELYSGRTTNPKELTGLQHEIDNLKANRGRLEDQALEFMETAEDLSGMIAGLEKQLQQLEEEWKKEQSRLTAELEELNGEISVLKEKREQAAGEIDPHLLDVYTEIKRLRGTSVAKVEQGICRGCRISLPVNELQQVRSGELVRCSSCGRILYLA